MHAQHWIACGAAVGALGATLGAFGAHAAPDWLAALGYDSAEATRRLAIFETGARYQMYAAVALLVAGFGKQVFGGAAWGAAGWLHLLGGLWFSSLLYALTFLGPAWSKLGAIVPLGGATMIGGWVTLAAAALLAGKKDRPPEA
ncbi:MAG: DUF423 domain-containing protein [Planctomycetota bacterium]